MLNPSFHKRFQYVSHLVCVCVGEGKSSVSRQFSKPTAVWTGRRNHGKIGTEKKPSKIRTRTSWPRLVLKLSLAPILPDISTSGFDELPLGLAPTFKNCNYENLRFIEVC